MDLDDLIAHLTKLRAEHGNLEVLVYQYAGGNDELCEVTPELRVNNPDHLGAYIHLDCTYRNN